MNFNTKTIATLLLFFFFFITINTTQAQNFTNVAASINLDHGNAKDGGGAWADFNNDGCLDLIFNTNSNNSGNRSRLMMSNCALPNPSFTDVTQSHANGLRQTKCERSVSVGDYNNDGYIDFCRNTHNRLEVYLNRGPSATPAYSFGDANLNPNFVLTNIANGINVEGFGWMDYDNDGFLDLVLENHNFGIDLFANPADGSANFYHTTPNGSNLGLPTGGTTGDYMTLCDYDDDGDVDILARKEDEMDLWTNTGAGTFTANTSFNQNASNSNKGGVVFCDFDNDGDFDMFWSDEGVNEIFEQTGLNSGNFVATNEPAASSGVTISNGIDGCSCGDVDNDGDMDLFIGGSGANNSYLFLNDGAGFSFNRNNLGINTTGDTEGNSFVDYDNDGDLDLFINVNGRANELWRNDLNDNDYLKIDVLKTLGSGQFREDLGATVVLKDCQGNIQGGIRQVSSIKGHGSNDPAVVHFGLPLGNNQSYLVEIHYVTLAGTRAVMDTLIVPSSETNQRIALASPIDNGVLDGCRLNILPVELVAFEAIAFESDVLLNWTTESEFNNDFFTIEKSMDASNWEALGTLKGAGTSNSVIDYNYEDTHPYFGTSYYRLKQTDFDGQVSYSNIEAVYLEDKNSNAVLVYPNPSYDQFTIQGNEEELSQMRLYNAMGQDVTNGLEIHGINSTKVEVNTQNLSPGVYILKTKNATRKITKQ